MSQEFMDPEIFSEFVVEAREHLENIEPSLLELEKNPDDPGLLDDIFRLMHSLKGASGFLGLSRINGLTHKAENILDEIRKGNINLTPAITDLILVSTDALKAMVENLEQTAKEGDVETASIIEKIDAMLQGEDQPAAPVSGLKPVLETPPAPKPPARPAPRETVVPEAPKVQKGEEPSQGYELTLVNQDHLGDFLEEAREIVEQLNDNLLTLEKNPESGGDIVNDIFRFFHNLKGNSGIIGYKELNGLTHEAETLLNKVRKQEIPVSHSLVDLLLDVVDSMDELLACIQEDGRVVPVDVSHTTDRVRHLLKTGEIKNAQPDTPPMQKEAASVETQEGEHSQDVVVDHEDVQIFSQTVAQQLSNINFALKSLEEDSGQPQIVDGLYRSLISIQNASGYMGLDEISGYVERVAGLVDQGRSSGIDFGLMIDILRQERDIVWDMINSELIALGGDSLKELVAASWGNGQAAGDDSAHEERGEDAGESDESETAQPRETLPEPEPVVEKKTSARETETSAGRSAAASSPRPSSSPAAGVAVTPASQSATDASPGNGSKTGQRAKLPSTIRVDHTKLDHLMNLIGELIINRNRFAMLARGLEEGQDVNEIAQKLSETTYSVGRISDDLQDTIMNVRMVPVQSVFSRFPRLVRDLSQKSGKQVELITEGEDTELDKSVVEEIGDPLVHLIRNAVDHGIETAEERDKTGKPDKARVWLRAFHKGNSVGIEVEDDGKGIDPKKMRTQAIRKGVITEEEARTMDDRASIELMFAPGFSTADKITDISGRGVGMDVVRNNIKNLKGSIAVQSVIGKGTRITLTLPLTLAIIDALMIRVDDATYALPLDAVSETTKIETTKLREVNGQKAVTLRGEVLGLVELAELLGLPRHDGKRDLLPTVVLTVNDRRLGLIVDTLLERQDVVIKSLGDYLGDLPGISGATIMGDGSVVLILDPHEIYRMATSRAGI